MPYQPAETYMLYSIAIIVTILYGVVGLLLGHGADKFWKVVTLFLWPIVLMGMIYYALSTPKMRKRVFK